MSHEIRTPLNGVIGMTGLLLDTELSPMQQELALTARASAASLGIAQEHLAHLFEPFTQADASTPRHYGGTGLGLTISKQLAQLMGATLEAQSTPGQDSTFSLTVSLPIDIDSKLQTAYVADCRRGTVLIMDEHEKDCRLSGDEVGIEQVSRVLVVEDNAVNQRVVQLMLEKQGCRVDLAANGHQALHLLEQGTYDLILMDCRMPEMDGYEATRRIRAQEQGKRRTPIIALTASAMEGDREKCLAAGMDAFLAKPISQSDLRTFLMSSLTRPEISPVPTASRAKDLSQERGSLFTALTARIGDDPERLRDFVRLFQDEASALLAACHEAVQRRDGEALTRDAHNLKGILMILDAGQDTGQAIELARLLEQGGRAKGIPDALHLLTILEARLRHIMTQLCSCIHSVPT